MNRNMIRNLLKLMKRIKQMINKIKLKKNYKIMTLNNLKLNQIKFKITVRKLSQMKV